MPLSAADSRAQRHPHGACPVREPGGGPATIVSPDDGHRMLVRADLWMELTRGRDLIIDSAPILA